MPMNMLVRTSPEPPADAPCLECLADEDAQADAGADGAEAHREAGAESGRLGRKGSRRRMQNPFSDLLGPSRVGAATGSCQSVLVERAADVNGAEYGKDERLDEGDEDLEQVDEDRAALQDRGGEVVLEDQRHGKEHGQDRVAASMLAKRRTLSETRRNTSLTAWIPR